RTMLPLNAEFRRAVVYCIADEGHMALHLAGSAGSPGRSKRTPKEQDAEFGVLNYLAAREQAREEALKASSGVTRELLDGMVRKKWITREDASHVADAVRVREVAVLKHAEGKLNANQKLLIDTLAAAGGRMAVEHLRELEVPRSTLGTLVKRGLVE